MLIDVTEKCTKETYEFGQSLRKFVKSVRKSLADGWQPGEDITAIMGSAISDLGVGVQGMEEIPKEPGENLRAFIASVDHSVRDVAFDFVEPLKE